MSTSNPFQIPSCLRANLQQRRQNRIKKIIIGVAALFVVGLVALLIAGCMSEHAKVSMAENMTGLVTNDITPAKIPVAEPVVPPQSSPAAPRSVGPNPTALPVLPGSHPYKPTYMVKAGDTLSHIAKLYHSTVKELKAVNELDTDAITVGMMLKVPTA